ncbi:alpha-2-macroglobulin-like isoform X1 [Paramormyrops kingsleyae]|uniref:alpha-2-macroglobulin-like isoform X1 n=1 Tax=Paramormyrops kingsleyae TaxID=1676925 RepID=UPI003B96B498
MWRRIFTACVLFCACQAQTDPSFLVTFPGVIPTGSETKFCSLLLHVNEMLQLTVSLVDGNQTTVLQEVHSDKDIYQCSHFQPPKVSVESIQVIRVELRGQDLQLVKETNVRIKPATPISFIQTDKPIYKPGQTVHFRIVSLDTTFAPVDQLYDVVQLEDPKFNRIAQWTNVRTDQKIQQLSHPLSSEAPLGGYVLRVFSGQHRSHYNFKVMDYVLPRFEVSLKVPSKVYILESQLKVSVCGRYTYGQAVPGKASFELCLSCPLKDVCCRHAESVQLEKSGCASHIFDMFFFYNSTAMGLETLMFNATVEEEETGIILAKSTPIDMVKRIGSVSFVDTPAFYEPGSTIEGKIKVTYYNDTPVANAELQLLQGYWYNRVPLLNGTTNADGILSFSINTTVFTGSRVNLMATCKSLLVPGFGLLYGTFNEPTETLSAIEAEAPHRQTYSLLSLKSIEKPLRCGSTVPIVVKYTLVGETSNANPLHIYYLVLSKGSIARAGQMAVPWSEGLYTEGETSFLLEAIEELSPIAQVLVYMVLPSGGVIGNNMDFSVEKCLKHKVSMEFTPSRAVPGENVELKVTALPGALCALASVDQSVLLLDASKRLSAEKIFDLLPVQRSAELPYWMDEASTCMPVRSKRYLSYDRDIFALSNFRSLGLKTISNLILRMPSCVFFKGRNYYYHHAVADRLSMISEAMPLMPKLAPLETKRTFFPETWIWDLVEVGDSGSARVSRVVPDTITTWETDAFCLSQAGLGLAPPLNLTVFQPFFLEITLPYSVVRGENFELKATVFNYLPKCIMVTVTAAPSTDYTLQACPGCQYSNCLCASERKTFKWVLVPSALGAVNVSISAEASSTETLCNNEVVSIPDRGRIDRVTRTLLVKAEGTEKTDSQSWLLCPSGKEIKESVQLQLPENVVEGSTRVTFSVLGDILGHALQNVENLLRMPYGCGEQNMVLLAPNIYLLHYLKATNQLTPATHEKATGFLKSGYQRQLNYKHHNGAFSTFGSGSGNNWLTAFVAKSFTSAQEFIYIEPKQMKEAHSWLFTTQKPDGCFLTVGKLFNNRMKGGVDDDVTLTAYITAAFLESKMSPQDAAVNRSLACLRSDSSYLTNTYTTALLAYTFSLAGDQEKRAQLLDHLKKIASDKEGGLHWSQSSSEKSEALSVEISSYVLLAVLATSPLTSTDLGYATKIVQWLVRQQNEYGGFSSTQDTVLALQALSVYATAVYSPDGSSTVSVQSAGAEQHHFTVNEDNRLLYQERALQDPQGLYSIAVQGTSCVSAQLVLHYNIPTPTLSTTFSVVTNTNSDCSSTRQQKILPLDFTIKYNGLMNNTNMVIVDVGMLSGFVPMQSSLKTLKTSISIDRVDVEDDHVIIYVAELHRDIPLTYTLQLEQQVNVKDLKPAIVKMYDYYQTSDYTLAEYTFPCA